MTFPPINTKIGTQGKSLNIVTDSGTATENRSDQINLNAAATCGSTVNFSGSGNSVTLNVTDGNFNTVIGSDSGNASLSAQNVGLGNGVLSSATAQLDVAIGVGVLAADTGGLNTGCGFNALASNTSGAFNTAVGYSAMGVSNCSNDVAIGFNALLSDTGGNNTAVGYNSLGVLLTGNSNVALGYNSGSSYTSSETGNIVIGNTGTAAESHVTRIGTAQTKCFIYGIEGVSVSNQAITTINTSTSQLGSVTTIPVANGGTGAATLTAHGVLIGEGTSAIAATAVGTSGIPLIGQGSSADPIFGTAVVGGGGTGVTSFSNTSALLASGTTTTGALQNIASVASGQVLTSAGTSTLPAWSAAPSITGITVGGGTELTTFVQGTWTPNLQINGSSTGITYTTQLGWYMQINNFVFVSFTIVLSSKGSSTGNVTISNMPVSYGPSGVDQSFPIAQIGNTSGTSFTSLSLTGTASSMVGDFFLSNINGSVGAAAMTNTNLANNTAFRAFGGYSIL